MIRRKPDRAWVLLEVVRAAAASLPDQHAEDPATAREIADCRVRLRVDARRQEALERVAGLVDDTQRRVAGAREIRGRLDDSLQHGIERELRAEGDPSLDQPAQPTLDRWHAVIIEMPAAAFQ